MFRNGSRSASVRSQLQARTMTKANRTPTFTPQRALVCSAFNPIVTRRSDGGGAMMHRSRARHAAFPATSHVLYSPSNFIPRCQPIDVDSGGTRANPPTSYGPQNRSSGHAGHLSGIGVGSAPIPALYIDGGLRKRFALLHTIER